MVYTLTDIIWDAPEDADLPAEVKVKVVKEVKGDLSEILASYLSDHYGFLVYSFCMLPEHL